MRLELRATADIAQQLARLKPLTSGRQGRARSQPIKIVWHESPDRALFTQGVALAEQRGSWRLERLIPGASTWLPGQPPPVLAEAADLAGLPAPPEQLAPVAAFEGRRITTQHRLGDSVLTMSIIRGISRSVADECAVLRLSLEGDDAVVRSAAMLIGEAIPVAIPTACLAAEAIGLATGQAPPPRHVGTPVLPSC
jgi:hypothetical protein